MMIFVVLSWFCLKNNLTIFQFFFLRCVIYNQKEKTYVTVRLIDSGHLQINDIRQLKMMPFGFMKFPRQAILIKKTNLTNFQEEWLKERELAIKINKENMAQLFYYENHVWKEM